MDTVPSAEEQQRKTAEEQQRKAAEERQRKAAYEAHGEELALGAAIKGLFTLVMWGIGGSIAVGLLTGYSRRTFKAGRLVSASQ